MYATPVLPSSAGLDGGHTVSFRPSFDAAEFDRFLLDPIGYGDFDYNDPISLDQYMDGPRMHTLYAAPLG